MTDQARNMEKEAEQHDEKVVHNYHDYANRVEGVAESAEDQHHSEELTRSMNRGEQNFPVKLHYMLSELETDGMDDIVSWQPHGRCFLVHKQQEFVDKVLHLWFRQTKFSSFQRQLNLYGFKRLTFGRDKCGYYHELFLRSKHFLSHRIQRLKIKGTGARKPSSPETEPNFYYDAPYLPSSRVPQDSLVNTILASGPNTTHLDTRGSLSREQPFASASLPREQPFGSSIFAASLLHQAQFGSPSLFYPSTNPNHLVEAQQAQAHAHLQRLRMAPFHQEMQMGSGFGQYHITGRQDDVSAAIALAVSRVKQDQAALAWSRSHMRGSLG